MSNGFVLHVLSSLRKHPFASFIFFYPENETNVECSFSHNSWHNETMLLHCVSFSNLALVCSAVLLLIGSLLSPAYFRCIKIVVALHVLQDSSASTIGNNDYREQSLRYYHVWSQSHRNDYIIHKSISLIISELARFLERKD